MRIIFIIDDSLQYGAKIILSPAQRKSDDGNLLHVWIPFLKIQQEEHLLPPILYHFLATRTRKVQLLMATQLLGHFYNNL